MKAEFSLVIPMLLSVGSFEGASKGSLGKLTLLG